MRAIHDTHERLDIWFCLDTLEYLRRGGRIGAAQALVGSALQIKPILTFGTEISPVGRVRTRKRAFERMVAYLGELHDRGATDWCVQHAQQPEDAAQLVARGTELLGSEPLFCTEVGPVLGDPPRLGSAGRGRRRRLGTLGALAEAAIERVAQRELARVVIEAKAGAVHGVGEADASRPGRRSRTSRRRPACRTRGRRTSRTRSAGTA